MIYQSTRGASAPVNSAQAVLKGLADDGGLYMMKELPEFDWQACLQKDTKGMAKQILSALLPEIQPMEELVEKAYTGKFETDLTDVTNIHERLDNLKPAAPDFVIMWSPPTRIAVARARC